jgi:hypothetical protein
MAKEISACLNVSCAIKALKFKMYRV